MRGLRVTLSIFAILMVSAPAMAQRGTRGGGARGAGAPNEGRGQGGPSLKIERDVEYARVGGQPLVLDLYRLEPLPAPRPVLVWIHGGDAGASKIVSPAAALINPAGVSVQSVSSFVAQH